MASVPWRCGHSWTVGPSPRSGTRVEHRSRVEQVVTGDDVDGLGRGAVSRSRRRPLPRAARAAAPPPATRAATARARGRHSGRAATAPPAGAAARPGRCRARRAAPGRSRRRLREVHARPRPARRPARPRSPVGRVPRDAAGVRSRSRPRRARRRARRACAALPPGPAHRSSQRSSRPSRGAFASARAHSWLPSSCTPARWVRTAARAPGSPPSRYTAYGDHRPALPPASASRSSREICPGHATRWVRGRSSSAASAAAVSSSGPSSGSPRASANAAAIHSGCAVRSARRPSGVSSRPSCSVQASQSRTGHATQDGVDETRRRGCGRSRAPGRRWSRPRRAAGCGCAAPGTRRGGAGRAPRAGRSDSDRSMHSASTRSSVPDGADGAVARARSRMPASRPVRPAARMSGGSARLAYAPSTSTARTSSVGRPPVGRPPATLSQGVSPASMRAPRAQSAAGIARLPGGCTRPSSTSAVAVPTATPARSACTWPGARSFAPRRRTGPSLSRSPRKVVQAPGAGVQARTSRSTCRAGRVPRHARVVDGDLAGAIDTPSGSCERGDERAVGDAVHRREQQAGARLRRAGRAGRRLVSVRADRLGHDAEHRTGVEAGLDQERGCAGDVVAVQDRVLDGRGAAPGGQQREVQVDPAVARHVERALRQQRAVGDHRAGSRRRARAQLGPGSRGRRAWPASARARLPRSASSATGEDVVRRPRPARRGRAGDHRDHVVTGCVQQRTQRWDGRRGRPGESEPHLSAD